jgi:membrane protein YqaA with SNARE-associated domain
LPVLILIIFLATFLGGVMGYEIGIYLEKLRKEFGIRTSKDLLKHLQRSGLLQNPDLNKLKKTDFNSWKAIMKQAIMATSANIK